MARTRVGLWTEGAVVTVVLAAFLISSVQLAAKGSPVVKSMIHSCRS